MKLEDQVVSLELAIKLRELGFEQKSYFVWVEKNGEFIIWNPTDYSDYETGGENILCSAYTVAELGEMLPHGFVVVKSKEDGWLCYAPVTSTFSKSKYEGVPNIWAFTEADVKAKMLIYLKENKII